MGDGPEVVFANCPRRDFQRVARSRTELKVSRVLQEHFHWDEQTNQVVSRTRVWPRSGLPLDEADRHRVQVRARLVLQVPPWGTQTHPMRSAVEVAGSDELGLRCQ